MQTSYTIKDEDMKQIIADKSLQSVKQILENTIATLIEARTVEVDCSDNFKAHLQYKGYIMALEDLWYQLFEDELQIGQDSEPIDYSEVF